MLHRTAHMSRDQFSQLMLVYTGMAADIAEIFEVWTDDVLQGPYKWILTDFTKILTPF